MRKEVAGLLHQTWASPVFGDSFGVVGPDKIKQATGQLNDITEALNDELGGYIEDILPEEGREETAALISDEILPKTTVFCPALTIGEIDDVPRLSALAANVFRMYHFDQSIDRGSEVMCQAVERLDPDIESAPAAVVPVEAVDRAYSSLLQIGRSIEAFTLPEDAPYIKDCFYGQVLVNEARMRRLSQAYQISPDPYKFLADHAQQIARTITVNAGFPSISSSLYAINRHHLDLPPLSEVYADKRMAEMLQTCNATVRLWDELGDWRMDRGDFPEKGVFTINLFNEHHPKLIDAFCAMANFKDQDQVNELQDYFAEFYHSDDVLRPKYGKYIEGVLLGHIRSYMKEIPRQTRRDFDRYITLSKRVLEIGYINRIGDIALGRG